MGNDTMLEVAFDKAGTKTLMANFSKMEKSDEVIFEGFSKIINVRSYGGVFRSCIYRL